MKKPVITVLIVTYNSAEYIGKCLKSVLSNIDSRFDINVIVADNASKDSSVDIVTKEFKSVQVVKNNDNLGFSGGINSALSAALEGNSEYFFILNPDTVLRSNTISKLFIHRDEAEILSPKIYFTDKPKVLWYAGGKIDWQNCYGKHIGVDEKDLGQYDQIRDLDYATGCSELIHRKVFESIGLMEEKYFLYMEDMDFSLRAKKNGFKIKFIPDSILYHHNAKSSGVGSQVQDYFFTRNRMYFALRYASFRTKIAVARQSLGFLINGRNAQKWGVIDFILGKMGAGSIFKKI